MKRYLITVTIVLPCIGAILGWQYLLQQPCTDIHISGMEYIDPESVHSLIGSTFSPPLIVDRLQRHPWIHGVHAVCYPTGTMQIDVNERQPWLLAVSDEGYPIYYIDEFGFMMPPQRHISFDVPIIRGMDEVYHPMKAVTHQNVQKLVAMIPTLPAEILTIISEFEVTDTGLNMILRDSEMNHVLVAQLGNEQWKHRLHKLRAFWIENDWNQADQVPGMIDLRFRGQIITRKKEI
ncbi:MAG: hypothetical protein OXE59_05525 [Bacteroidetes bacterium]|nr:hypothetical protein [Bacteroidota bacterium]MCY4233184.1 hypothetical protein [Bacteroidota bacterium]